MQKKPQPISGKQPQESQRQKQRAEDEKQGEKEKRENQKLQAKQQKPEQEKLSEKEKKGGKVDNDRVEDGEVPEAKTGTLSDLAREAKRWGLLPPKVVEVMLFSTGKEAPPEYREIISRYYKRMMEMQTKGR
ncbi:MAG: hypothetical protein HY721_10790 [Planctomycetes bacterium]|nr:hypothetical protein [Planctomycetota bacterium]